MSTHLTAYQLIKFSLVDLTSIPQNQLWLLSALKAERFFSGRNHHYWNGKETPLRYGRQFYFQWPPFLSLFLSYMLNIGSSHSLSEIEQEAENKCLFCPRRLSYGFMSGQCSCLLLGYLPRICLSVCASAEPKMCAIENRYTTTFLQCP